MAWDESLSFYLKLVSIHRPEVAVKPGQGLLDVFDSGGNMVGLANDELLVIRRSPQKVEHGLDRGFDVVERIISAVQHQCRYFDPAHVVNLVGLGKS